MYSGTCSKIQYAVGVAKLLRGVLSLLGVYSEYGGACGVCTAESSSLHVSWIVMQVRSDGTLMDTDESSSYHWLPKTLLGEVGNMSPSKLVPQISTPFSTAPLSKLLYLL